VAITFVNEAVDSAVDGGTPSVDLTDIAGLAQNDVVLGFCCTSGGTQTTPSGWTHISNRSIVSGSETLRWLLCYKVMGASPDSSVTFWDSGTSGDAGAAIAVAFRGVDTTTPFQSDYDEFNNYEHEEEAPTTVPPTPSITPDIDNCAIVVFGGANKEEADPGGISNYTTAGDAAGADNREAAVAAAYRILVGGAAVEQSPGAWSSWGSQTGVAIGITVALRDATAPRTVTATPTIAAFTNGATGTVIVAAASTPTFSNFTAMATADNAEAFVGNLATASPTIGAFTLDAFIASASLAKYDIRGRSSGRSIVCRPL
jgi:hypothetical protein